MHVVRHLLSQAAWSALHRILMVDGDHRVAIMASREIADGSELTYDYLYDKRVAPDWAVTEQEWREAGEAAAAAKKQAAKQRQRPPSGDGNERE